MTRSLGRPACAVALVCVAPAATSGQTADTLRPPTLPPITVTVTRAERPLYVSSVVINAARGRFYEPAPGRNAYVGAFRRSWSVSEAFHGDSDESQDDMEHRRDRSDVRGVHATRRGGAGIGCGPG